MLTALDLLVECRDALQDPDARSFGDDNFLLRELSTYQRSLYERARRPGLQLFTVAKPLTAAAFTSVRTEEYRLRLAYFQRNVTRLMRTDLNPPAPVPSIRSSGIAPERWDPDRDMSWSSDPGLQYDLIGTELRLYGTLPATATFDLWYEHPPADLLSNVKIKAGGSTISLIIDLTGAAKGIIRRIDDYYVGSFAVLTTAASHQNIGVPTLITAFNGADVTGNPVLTVDELPVNPTAGDLFALASPIPPEFHSLIALGAALRIAGTRTAGRRYQLLADQVRRLEADFTASIGSRMQDETRHTYETEETL